MSFNLEEYLYNKDVQNCKMKKGQEGETPYGDGNEGPDGDKPKVKNDKEGLIDKCLHMSITSDKQLEKLGRQFMKEHPSKNRQGKSKIRKRHPSQQIDKAYNDNPLNTEKDVEKSCSTVHLKECLACMSSISDAVLMPCGHGGLCY